MDLDDAISQEILDQGIQVPSKKQVIGLYHGKIYAFQPDGSGGYHGYPISGKELMQKYPKVAKEVAKELDINIKQIKNIEI